MRYPASEKLEIINLVEQSHLPARRTLDRLGIPRRTFYRWYDRYLGGGPEALEDRPSAPSRMWNRIPAAIHDQIIEMALEQSELSPRELAVSFTDETRYNGPAPDGPDIGNVVNGNRTDQLWREMQARKRRLDEVRRRQSSSGQRLSNPSFQQGEVLKAEIIRCRFPFNSANPTSTISVCCSRT